MTQNTKRLKIISPVKFLVWLIGWTRCFQFGVVSKIWTNCHKASKWVSRFNFARLLTDAKCSKQNGSKHCQYSKALSRYVVSLQPFLDVCLSTYEIRKFFLTITRLFEKKRLYLGGIFVCTIVSLLSNISPIIAIALSTTTNRNGLFILFSLCFIFFNVIQ